MAAHYVAVDTVGNHPGTELTQLAQHAALRSMAARIRETAISQLRRCVLEFFVLALLRDGERYSYELVHALGNADGLVTTEGTLYPLLGRLRGEGVVDTTWRESPSGPPRRYYRLTQDGQAALGGFVIEWTRFRDSVDALLGNGVLGRSAASGRAPGSSGTREWAAIILLLFGGFIFAVGWFAGLILL